jgi:preprotein translocase subunit YajC
MYYNEFLMVTLVVMTVIFALGIRKQMQHRQKQTELLERIATALENRKP